MDWKTMLANVQDRYCAARQPVQIRSTAGTDFSREVLQTRHKRTLFSSSK